MWKISDNLEITKPSTNNIINNNGSNNKDEHKGERKTDFLLMSDAQYSWREAKEGKSINIYFFKIPSYHRLSWSEWLCEYL